MKDCGNLESLCLMKNNINNNINVKYVGLNFKDVMISYSKIKIKNSILGYEFSRYDNNNKVMENCITKKYIVQKHIYAMWKIIFWQLYQLFSLLYIMH